MKVYVGREMTVSETVLRGNGTSHEGMNRGLANSPKSPTSPTSPTASADGSWTEMQQNEDEVIRRARRSQLAKVNRHLNFAEGIQVHRLLGVPVPSTLLNPIARSESTVSQGRADEISFMSFEDAPTPSGATTSFGWKSKLRSSDRKAKEIGSTSFMDMREPRNR